MSEILSLVKTHPKFETLPQELKSNLLEIFKVPDPVEGNLVDTTTKWSPIFVKLIQKTGNIPDIVPGMMVGREVIKPPLALIPLVMWQSRLLWGAPGTDEAQQILCRSSDGKIPDEENELGVKECAACPRRKDPDKKKKCRISLNICGLGRSGETNSTIGIYVLPFYGTSYMTGLSVYKQVKNSNPLYRYCFKLHPQKESNKALVYYKYVIDEILPTDKAFFDGLEICKQHTLEYVTGLLARREEVVASEPPVEV